MLQSSDQLELSPGARATVVRPEGNSQVNGPLRARLTELPGSSHSPASQPSEKILETALFAPVVELRAAGLLATVRSSQGITIYSPAGATVRLRPTLLWQSQPGKTYEVAIFDASRSSTLPWRARAVTSPLAFSQLTGGQDRGLTPSGLYRIQINESGNLLSATERTFQVLATVSEPAAESPIERLLEAYKILVAEPARLGDALTELLTLPPDLAATPLALRLKLLALGRLGDQAEFSEMLSRLPNTW